MYKIHCYHGALATTTYVCSFLLLQNKSYPLHSDPRSLSLQPRHHHLPCLCFSLPSVPLVSGVLSLFLACFTEHTILKFPSISSFPLKFLFFLAAACGDSVPWPGIEPGPLVWKPGTRKLPAEAQFFLTDLLPNVDKKFHSVIFIFRLSLPKCSRLNLILRYSVSLKLLSEASPLEHRLWVSVVWLMIYDHFHRKVCQAQLPRKDWS